MGKKNAGNQEFILFSNCFYPLKDQPFFICSLSYTFLQVPFQNVG